MEKKQITLIENNNYKNKLIKNTYSILVNKKQGIVV